MDKQIVTTEEEVKTDTVDDKNVDDKKIGEDTFDESVFDNPKLWTHPRFKKLSEKAQLADQLKKDMAKAEEAKLVESKKFEELANKRAEELEGLKARFNQVLQDNAIIQEANKLGVIDTEAVLKLLDRASVQIDENNNVLGVNEALQALVSNKPYLVGGKPVKIGTATNPPADTDTAHKRFKLSQLQDAKFFKENEADINTAYRLGLIEDDMSQ